MSIDPSSLQHSLAKLLDHAEDYAADLRFDYPSLTPLWAHRAILLARAPEPFLRRYMSALVDADNDKDRLSNENSEQTLLVISDSPLPHNVLRSFLRFWYTGEWPSPDNLMPSLMRDQPPSPADSAVSTLSTTEMEVCALTRELESYDALGYNRTLADDLDRMRLQKLATDAFITLESNDSVAVHRGLLAARSNYFYAIFCTDFAQQKGQGVRLPGDLFTLPVLDVILSYLYTDALPPLCEPTAPLQAKKYALRVLRDAYRAADYLGHADMIGDAVLNAMAGLCHGFKCVCTECAMLLPSMLLFAEKHNHAKMREALINLYADPIHSLAHLWSTRPFATLVQSRRPMIPDIMKQTLANIKKQTAIQVLESLHLCLSRLRSADPTPTWSAPVRDHVVEPIVHHTVVMISNNFGFYCVDYPIIPSCVDNGFGFSIDFLEFLLRRVLHQGIIDYNAAQLYQSIVRDLIGRQELEGSRPVDNVLLDARQRCVEYLRLHWTGVKAQGGFRSIEKDILRLLAEDIDVPYRALTKSFETDLASLFGLRAARAALRPKKQSSDDLRMRRSASMRTCTQSTPPSYFDYPSKAPRMSADYALEGRHESEHAPPHQMHRFSSTSSILLADALLPMDNVVIGSGGQPTPPSTTEPRRSRLRFQLPETPQRYHTISVPPTRSNSKNRSRSPLHKYRLRLSTSSSGSSSEDNASDEETPTRVVPMLGTKVELLRRPLPMQGVIKYIGPVEFAKGTYVGIELEKRLGSSDGSVNGTRYFQTDPQRGAFCKLDDFKILSLPH
ncbi:hypothetical protein BCR43DRAFT_486405 [Syncephalastrum racemosum]|uniref:CAP-Gly domain-containing protein n=1 Tax=Syncephalastrum racemosum TaxID=13706 RepID=A0A1X2HNZ0_SYNRA|nr:hypothetical protein BCR43DRAFT_486405 [Syncephalastrum racemosum]